MQNMAFKFYKGEEENPFDYETDLSRHMFWAWERTAAEQRVDAAEWFARFGKYANKIVREWNAPKSQKGLLLWMMDMCGKWAPEEYAGTDWRLYVKSAA